MSQKGTKAGQNSENRRKPTKGGKTGGKQATVPAMWHGVAVPPGTVVPPPILPSARDFYLRPVRAFV